MRSSIPGLGRVMVFLAAALASASFAIPEDWGEEGVQYGQLGTDVTLSCPGVRASSPVRWRRAGAMALPEGSAIQQGSLVLPSASLASAGTYSCHGEDGGLLHSVSLRLGHLPGVPFVSCRASDYENFSCSWTSSVETFLPTRYITTYRKKSLTGEEKRRNKNGHVGLCLQDPSRPGTCTVHRSEFWSSYRLNITEVNPLGFSYRLLDVTMQAIIKPDPPEGLVVEPVPLAPRRLHVSWKYPSSWPKEPHFQLRFRLQYRPIIHRSWSVVETVNLSEVITDAFAGLEHVVQVSAKDFLDAGNWSEWSAEARATPVRDLASTASEETTTDARLESLAEEPSQAPNPEPINRSDPLEKMAILVSLGIFAFFILAAVLVITILICRSSDPVASPGRSLLPAPACPRVGLDATAGPQGPHASRVTPQLWTLPEPPTPWGCRMDPKERGSALRSVGLPEPTRSQLESLQAQGDRPAPPLSAAKQMGIRH
ncbi:interleukin-11 receptor subunit alpha isoform X1 [Onychostruthus taczanowskii]|uniref:interleukin-11 receptor subunit alpha isoform X1 n=1 Tax=Onychostruthus taczanowskii TaxID=356909 RepID=UPI001B8085FD|nr:interleukin-11 receptor subunit alpha isoform X1 [Onychostruthus taczanowskii]XP_041277878.1 interleukin-11 receptor subunit alpha isoform X1 [Onychostruthus taczanowskii]